MDIHSDKFISICTGAGGLDIGIERGSGKQAIPICYVENEITSATVLAARMEDKRLSSAPIWTDLKTFDFSAWKGVEGIAGGYPCTPFNSGGPRMGSSDPRYLWNFIANGIETVDPIWCFFENVGAHLTYGFSSISEDLLSMGYKVAATLVTAQEVGAPHKRERLFILGVKQSIMDNANGRRSQQETVRLVGKASRSECYMGKPRTYPPRPKSSEWDNISANLQPALPKSEFRRMVNGLGHRVDLTRSDRLRIIGNGVVPNQAAYAWRELWNEIIITEK